MKSWYAPSGVLVYSNAERPPDRLIDRSAAAQRLWSAQFVLKKIISSFRQRRDEGFHYQKSGYHSTFRAEQAWTKAVREQTQVQDAVVFYDGLKWNIQGSLDGCGFSGGTESVSKRAGRTFKQWRVSWLYESPFEVPLSLTPVEAVVDALYRYYGLIREEV